MEERWVLEIEAKRCGIATFIRNTEDEVRSIADNWWKDYDVIRYRIFRAELVRERVKS